MPTPNPHRLRLRPNAASDLEEIVRFLDGQSTAAADRFVEAFFEASERLAEMPGLGAARRTRGRLKGLRSWPLTNFGPYLVFYMPLKEGGVEVVRVLHGARNIERELRRT